MRNLFITTASIFLVSISHLIANETDNATQNVLTRFLGDKASSIKFKINPALKDEARIKNDAGKLTIEGADPVAVIHGTYSYLKSNGWAMSSWSGNRIALPKHWPQDINYRTQTPFSNRYYFNVVTYGYTTPYWDWARWEKEIDWMALHGFNMPLALVANEAIGERVWKRLGLTQDEIDCFYTGPAHLPWQRMGNISKHDGPLSSNWHKQQVSLQHKILKRLRDLKMKPIVPAFAGFVPKDITRISPKTHIQPLSWGGFAHDKRAYILSPNDPLFAKIGKMFIEEWEKEFGKCEFYLADSFNEMELPKTDSPVTELLANYGEAILNSIQAGNPNATWVVQGWMFGYQRHIWTPENTKALFSKVPDHKIFILDEAFDYNAVFWRNGMNYELYNGFNGKQWGMGFIPNMGGKTGWTGLFSYYARSVNEALNSPKKGNLIGYGLAPEGIENNDVLYEMLSDLPWQSEKIDIDAWIQQLCIARYGAYPENMKKAWKCFFESCYGTFTDHPRLGWQTMGFGGTLNQSDKFLEGVELFISMVNEFKNEPLYTADALDLSAAYLGIKANQWFGLAKRAHDQGDTSLRDSALKQALTLMNKTDLLLESHPNLKLSNWINLARNQGVTAEEKTKYEYNARRLVTIWGPPINDYSARMWSGLIRDFYAPRMKAYFDSLKDNRHFNRSEWEEKWVNSEGISHVNKLTNPTLSAKQWIIEAKKRALPQMNADVGFLVGEWFPNQLSTTPSIVEFDVPLAQVKAAKRIRFNFKQGAHRLNIHEVAIILDGDEVWRDTRNGFAGTPSQGNVYTYTLNNSSKGNNTCKIRIRVSTDGGNNSQGQIRLLK